MRGHAKVERVPEVGRIRRVRRVRLALVTAALFPLAAPAQFVDLWQPSPVDPWRAKSISDPAAWVPTLKYIKTDVEVEHNSFHPASGPGQQDFERLYFSPGLAVQWDQYIYHPYLLTMSSLFEPSYLLRYEGPSGAVRRTDDVRLDGVWSGNFLQVKPYATTVSYTRSHGEVKYDLFDSAIVDTQGWGVTTGYRDGPVPVTLSYQHTHEESSGFTQNATTDQDSLNLHARNERKSEDATDFIYQFGQFDRELNYAGPHYRSENSYHHVALNDVEHYRKSVLRSELLFYDLESSTSSTEDLNANLFYNVEHTPQLHSYDNYSFSYN